MKIAVFDRVNEDRLLGHLEIAEAPDSPRYYHTAALQGKMRSVAFSVAFSVDRRITTTRQQIDALTTETTTFSRTCFVTDVALELLMVTDGFTLPGEDAARAQHRRSSP